MPRASAPRRQTRNVMVRRTVRQVLDFGLARPCSARREQRITLDQTGRLMGTARYMSPEQARGDAWGRRRTCFSLGIILYQWRRPASLRGRLVLGTLPPSSRKLPRRRRSPTRNRHVARQPHSRDPGQGCGPRPPPPTSSRPDRCQPAGRETPLILHDFAGHCTVWRSSWRCWRAERFLARRPQAPPLTDKESWPRDFTNSTGDRVL